MVDAVLDWVLPQWAATKARFFELSGKPIPSDVKRCLGTAKPLLNRATVETRIPIDLRGWKYGDRKQELIQRELNSILESKSMLSQKITEVPEEHKAMLTMMLKMFDNQIEQVEHQTIAVTLAHDTASMSGGSWAPNLNHLSINFDVKTTEEDLRLIVEHEMRHVAQMLLAKTSGQVVRDLNTAPYGFPSRKIRTPHQQDQKKYDPVLHTLDDREFYTLLADAILQIHKTLAKQDPLHKASVFSMLVGRPIFKPVPVTYTTHPFFQRLKDHAPGKYTKAVMEARKALGLRDDWASRIIE